MDNRNISRRRVMKAVGASAAAGTVGVSSAAAEERVNTDVEGCKAEVAYESAEEVEALINEYEPFLEALAEREALSESEVTITELLSDEEYLQTDNGARSWGMQYYGNHLATPHITVRRKTAQGRATIAFNPNLDNGIRAIIKPDALLGTENPELGHEVTLIRAESTETTPEVLRKQYVPKTPDEIQSLDDEIQMAEIEPSPQGRVIYGCKQYGGYGCDTKDCMQWEGECSGSDCNWYDCTGIQCCDGCCCCEDITNCCDVCDDVDCTHDCSLDDSTCYNGGCCDCC